MTNAQFYLLDDIGDTQLLPFICQRVCIYYRQGQRVLVMAADQKQAEAIDELLWQLPVDAFIPHSISGENANNSPVEISWPGQSLRIQRGCLINLAAQVEAMAARYQHAIDVVPVEATLRAQARQRYKQYRQLGFALTTEQAQLAHD